MLLKNSIENELQRRAIDLAIRRKTFHLGAFRFAFVALLALGAVIDFFIPLPAFARCLFLAGWVLTVGALFRRYWTSRKALYTAQEVARDYEKSIQTKDLTLSTAVDPTVIESAAADPKRQALLERLQNLAGQKLQSIPASKVNQRWNFKWRFWVVAALLGLMFIGFTTKWIAVERMLLPWANLSYTRVFVIHEGSLNPVPGESYPVQGFIQGRYVGRVEVFQQGKPKPIATGAIAGDRSFHLNLPGIESEISIVVRAGDGQTEPIRVFPFNFESGLEYEITLTPPNYTQSDPVKITEPNFSALRGSRMTYRVQLPSGFRALVWDKVQSLENESPLKSRINSFSPNSAKPGQWISDGAALQESFSYHLKLIDQHSGEYSNEIPFQIQALPDTAPSIRLTQTSDEKDLLNDPPLLKLKLAVEDDAGLESVQLVFRRIGEESRTIELELPADRPLLKWNHQEEIDLSDMNLVPGEILIAQAKATDNNTLDGPGIGLSEMLFIEIPFPPSEDGSGGGGGAGESVVINPLENQKRILNETIGFMRGDSDLKLETLVLDQTQNLDWTRQLTEALEDGNADLPVLVQLYRANAAMDRAADQLAREQMTDALLEEEEALAGLVEALKLMGQQPPGEPSEESQPGMTISLQRPSTSSQSEGDPNAEQNAIEDLLNQLRDALEHQQGLQDQLAQNPGSGQGQNGDSQSDQESDPSDPTDSESEEQSTPSEWDQEESELAQQVQSLMNQLSALGMPWVASQNPSGAGAMQQALAQLQNASTAEQAAALAFAQSQMEQAENLAGAGASAMEQALNQLESLMMGDTVTGVESVSAPGRYQRWVIDYLRSVSYEE